MRRVGLRLYATPCTIDERVDRVKSLDTDLQLWLSTLPAHLQVEEQNAAEPSLKPRSSTSYTVKQSVVLKLRRCKRKHRATPFAHVKGRLLQHENGSSRRLHESFTPD